MTAEMPTLGTLWWTAPEYSSSLGSYRDADGVLVLIVGEPFAELGVRWVHAVVCQPGLEEAGEVDVMIDDFETSTRAAIAVDVDQRLTLDIEQLEEFAGRLSDEAAAIVLDGLRGGALDRRGPAFEGPDDPRLLIRPEETVLACLRAPFLEATDRAAAAADGTASVHRPSESDAYGELVVGPWVRLQPEAALAAQSPTLPAGKTFPRQRLEASGPDGRNATVEVAGRENRLLCWQIAGQSLRLGDTQLTATRPVMVELPRESSQQADVLAFLSQQLEWDE